MKLIPEQVEGARFMARSPVACNADEAGYGKTAQAIAAADLVGATSILVVTTASGRAAWVREFATWSCFRRDVRACLGPDFRGVVTQADVVIIGWAAVHKRLAELSRRQWDVLILDEAHYASNPEALRTRAVYGYRGKGGLASRATHVWPMSATFMPKTPDNLHVMLQRLAPERIDNMGREAFIARYCEVRPRFINGVTIDTVVGGKNMAELARRLKGLFIRRTTEGLPGMRTAVLPLSVPWQEAAAVARAEQAADIAAIVAAAEAGETAKLEMHLGTLRRLTGMAKAEPVAEVIADDLQGGVDKIVVFAWHTAVIDLLAEKLAKFRPVVLDGRTAPTARQAAVDAFQTQPDVRVFIGQIQAAGEAITLTAAASVIFAEASFVPKDMYQAVRRIRRRGQTRPCLARIAALPGSIDERLMELVRRRMADIKTLQETDE